MSVIDSSAWIEYLVDGPNAGAFEAQLISDEVVFPSITIFEVTRWLLSQGRTDVLPTVRGLMGRGRVVSLDAELAASAGELGIRYRLPLADSIVYATAQALRQEVCTQDKDFEGLPGVHYLPKRPL